MFLAVRTPSPSFVQRVAPWALASAWAFTLAGCGGSDAITPTGAQLHATQELVRNNGSEPDSLDPALTLSVAPPMWCGRCLKD